MKNFFKNILTNTGPKILFKNRFFISNNKVVGENFAINSFGKKNQKKIFYIINRSPGAGLFSNVTFVLNHISVEQDPLLSIYHDVVVVKLKLHLELSVLILLFHL